MSVFKMTVLLCSFATTPNLDDCTEKSAIAVNAMTRIAPYAKRCDHDSQHEQAQLLYQDQIKGLALQQAGVGVYNRADRKIKVLCEEIPEGGK